jgi:hypothetical protein
VSFLASENDGSELPVILDTARTMQWKSAVYVGDTTTDTKFFDRLLKSNGSFDLQDIVSVNEESDTISLYARIEHSKVDFVLVHCQSYRCYGIIKKLFHLRVEESLQNSSVPWIITESLTQNTQSAASFGALRVPPITYGLQKKIPSSPLSDVLLDNVLSLEQTSSRCSSLEHCSVTVHQQLKVLAFYDALTVLLHLLNDDKPRIFKDSSELIQFINGANVNGITRAVRFDHMSSERRHPVLYNVVDIGPSLVAKIGVFDNSGSVWLHQLTPLTGQHSTKRGRYKRATPCEPAKGHFRITTMIEPPFIIYDPNMTMREVHAGPYAGFVVDMIDWLSKDLNFTYTMSEPPDLKYGSVNESGTLSGMVRQLVDCEADLAGAAFAITSKRAEHIHFTKPYIDAGKTLLVYKGESTSKNLWAFLSPFDFTTKVVVVVSLVVVTIAFAILRKLSLCFGDPELAEQYRRQHSRWPANPLWFLYTTFMQQGPDVIPSIGGKILVAGWFFFSLVIVATYTANLAAFLTVRRFEDSIQSIDDLAAQTDIVYGTVKDTSITEFFATSPLEVHRRMHWFMTNTPGALVDTAEEAYDRVHYRKQGEYVFIWDEPILDYVSSHKPCKSQVVGRAFIPQGYGFALPMGMPYEPNFSQGILKMREIGLIHTLRRKWLQTGPCSSSTTAQDVTDANEVQLSDMLGVFVTLGVTVGASLVIGVIELLWWQRKKYLKAKSQNKGAHNVMAANRTLRATDVNPYSTGLNPDGMKRKSPGQLPTTNGNVVQYVYNL